MWTLFYYHHQIIVSRMYLILFLLSSLKHFPPPSTLIYPLLFEGSLHFPYCRRLHQRCFYLICEYPPYYLIYIHSTFLCVRVKNRIFFIEILMIHFLCSSSTVNVSFLFMFSSFHFIFLFPSFLGVFFVILTSPLS